MLIKIRHGLLEVTDYPGTRKSAVIFNNDVIITSATILYPYLQKADQISREVESDSIVKELQQFNIVSAGVDLFDFLNSINFEIVCDKSGIRTKARVLTKYKASILYIFNCSDVSKSTTNILGDLNPRNIDENNEIYNSKLHKTLISSFILLKIVQSGNEKNTRNIQDFIYLIKSYIKFMEPINKLDDVLTISTPFGLERFYKTVNIGKVSNVFGKNNCLFLISNSLVEGCEGSAVFNSKLKLLGLIICTSLRWQNENANLTLAANCENLLTEFLIQIGEKSNRKLISNKPYLASWENSIVLISNHGSWGTGTFVKLCEKKFVLTCAHVVRNTGTKALCHYSNGNFEAEIIWKNETENKYDIALLSTPSTIPDKYFAKICNEKPKLGQNIYCAGFPLFAHLGEEVFKPSIFEGRIIKYPDGMIISDSVVQAGQSGGPMFHENGMILGICVSNVRDEMTKTIYPKVNMAVPLFEIKSILEKFAKTNDIQHLTDLVGEDVKGVWALETPFIQSKL